MATTRPLWGADCPISLPLPSGDPVLVPMQGFAMSQFRLVHDITAKEYEDLSVPVYAPYDPSLPTVADDAELDVAKSPVPPPGHFPSSGFITPQAPPPVPPPAATDSGPPASLPVVSLPSDLLEDQAGGVLADESGGFMQ